MLGYVNKMPTTTIYFPVVLFLSSGLLAAAAATHDFRGNGADASTANNQVNIRHRRQCQTGDRKQLTLAEAAWVAGIRKQGIAKKPDPKACRQLKSKKVSLKAVKALQNLPPANLAKVIGIYTGDDSLDPETLDVIKTMEPEELQSIINSGKALNLLTPTKATPPFNFAQKNLALPGIQPIGASVLSAGQCPQGTSIVPVEVKVPASQHIDSGILHPVTVVMYRCLPLGAAGFGGAAAVRSVQVAGTPTGNTPPSPGAISDKQLKFLKGLSPATIVRLVKKFTGRVISLDTAQKIKISSNDEIRAMWADENKGSETGPPPVNTQRTVGLFQVNQQPAASASAFPGVMPQFVFTPKQIKQIQGFHRSQIRTK